MTAELKVALSFDPKDATTDELRRLAHDAVGLLGLSVSYDYGIAVLEVLGKELKYRCVEQLERRVDYIKPFVFEPEPPAVFDWDALSRLRKTSGPWY